MVRLGTVLAIIAAFYLLWTISIVVSLITAVVLLAIFVRLIYRDLENRAFMKHIEFLLQVNRDELKALNGEYQQFEDGTALAPKEHDYAADIDIFGHASVFQFFNRTTSDPGAGRLADWLSAPATSADILARQEAVKELAGKADWRQDLQAYGRETRIRTTTVDRLQAWLHEPGLFIQFRHWQWLRYVLPGIILVIVAAASFKQLPMNVMYGSLLIYALIAYKVNKVVAPLHERLSRIVDEMDILAQSIDLIEKEHFKSPELQSIQAHFNAANGKASTKINRLKKILDRLDIRYNIVISAPLNILLLWNLQQVLDLEKWKRQYTDDVTGWFSNLGMMEALNSFATIHFNNPDWCFARLKDDHFFLEANGLGHPLIASGKRIDNSIRIEKQAKLMIVTGSNMAGKSTYLRSVGVNVILAMAGAPCCATDMTLSPVKLISSMRIADNLEESTSTFYAELKKLKSVIDKVNAGEKVFILLDEILRGTNSLDRQTGSIALVKQLIKKQAVGIIATHDIALAEMEKEFPGSIINAHFDAQINQEELYFDYLLKPGVCKSINASILMRKIGIEM